MQALSRTLFGQAHRLSVMVAIARGDGVVNPSDLASGLGLVQSSIQLPMRDLEAAGLISRLPTSVGRTYFTRSKSKVWEWAEELVSSFDTVGPQSAESRLTH